MKTYSVEVRWNGKNFAEVIRATSAGDAMSVVKMKYPGCAIFKATIVG
jgi:hypothetical protein